MGKNISKVTTTFQFCDGGSCQKANGELAIREARAYLRNKDLWDDTHTIKTRCNGRCEDAPTWIVQPGNFWYKNLTPEKALTIMSSHLEDDKPVEDYLLYQEGWSVLRSSNEKTIAPPVFKTKTDPDYGAILVARAFASDQHLYPLFQYLFKTPQPVGVQIGTDNMVVLREPHHVDYSAPYDLKLTGTQVQLTLAIAGIPKTVSEEISNRKVSVAEVIWLKEKTTFTKAIRLKNKKGKHLVSIWIQDEDTSTWAHILKIYLAMPSQHNIRIETHESQEH